MGTADLAQKIANMTGNGKDPVITDLNMVIVTMKMEGKTNSQIANELGVSLPDITYHIKRFHTLTGLKTAGEITDPINNQRARLLKRLRKTDTIIGKALRDYGKSDRLSVNASNVAIAVNKGLGVLVDKTEVSGQVDLLAQRRDDMRARLDACRQFGLNPADELKAVEAEVVEDVGGTGTAPGKSSTCEERPVSAQAKAVPPAVSRETPQEETVDKAETQPETPAPKPIKAETIVNQPVIKAQTAAGRSSELAGSPQAKPPRRTLSNSKW